jgi:hypothetical protein
MRSGVMVSEVAAGVIESLGEGAYPGEDTGEVVVEMMTGTIRTALVESDVADVVRATELIVRARDRLVEHLQLVLELSRRRDEGGYG